MKSKILFLALLTVAIFSCKKEQSNPSNDITGRWNWIISIKTNPLEYKTPETTGRTELIEFRKDQTWIKFQNDIPKDSGTYSMGHRSYSPYEGAQVYTYDSVVYRDYSSQILHHDYYKIQKDTLYFSGGFAGLMGSESSYYKKK